MNNCWCRCCRFIIPALFLWLTSSLFNPLFAGTRAAANWNVTVLDKILAGVPSGQTLAQVGDMQIQVSLLQNWRNQLAGARQPQLAFEGSISTWPDGDIYYSFSNNVSAVEQQAFLDGAEEWAMFANLHFIPWTTQANYVTIFLGQGLEGGESEVGMVGGQQFLQIGPNSWNRPTICHEIGHTLGLVHEQQRSDRDNYVTILTNNILPGQEGNFIELPNSQNETPYDFLSIMEYSRNELSVSPSIDTIEPLPAYTNFINIMGVQFDPVLSVSDRAGMAAVYGPGPVITNIVTNTQDSGPGSLRAALYYAFDHPGTTITFDIPESDSGFSNNVFNILPTDGFPSLVNATILDGATEPVNANPDGPQILLNGILGQSLSVFPSGLQFKGTNCLARSFIINNFPEAGVLITGSGASGNTVSGCYLGTDPSGLIAETNVFYPAEISGGAVSNVIGGTTVAERNIISGSAYQGLAIRDPGTQDNIVEGNYIGLNANGTPLPNAWAGIQIFGGAQSNLIGGYTASARNIISGNMFQGIAISDPTTGGNIVAGNYIGLDPSGTTAMPNGYAGVDIFGGSFSNYVGGTVSGAGNVISGNIYQGVSISSNGAVANVVQGNLIGLNAAGAMAIPNGEAGVGIYTGAQSNLIGGTSVSARNIISGNGEQGVAVGNPGTSGNTIQGNYIGVNPAGTAAVSNTWAGVNFFDGAVSNLVGGVLPGAGNVISGNGIQGVLIQDAGTENNSVQGNFIGLNATGNAAIPNLASGIEIYNGPSANFVGGYGGRNFISGNAGYGIDIDYGSSGNVVQGNTIGLDAQNSTVIPNVMANVLLYVDVTSNLIGGTTLGAANLISGSPGGGVLVYYDSTNNPIRGNSIFNNNGTAIFLYAGGNNDLAAPVLSSADVTTNTTITGTYDGTNDTLYQLDFYADAPPAADAEAMTYLGSTSITGTGSPAVFTVNLGAHLPAGEAVTATVTDSAGNTSQLSPGIAATMTSSVNDGIPDAWRALYFGGDGTKTNSESAATADPDHDGFDNYATFLAGTNPTNAASVLKLTAFDPNVSTNVISLNSAAGTVYRVEYCDNLLANEWSILADQLVGNGTNLFLPDPSAASVSQRFYRAQVLW
jgi:parallel beta-helix repeat protein